MKKILLVTLTLFFIQLSFGQEFNFSTSKWRAGGGLGLGFGDNSYFGFNVSPFVGYEFSRIIEGGATLGLDYGKDDFYKRTLFSIGPYLNFNFVPSFFGRVHYEYFTGKSKYEFEGVDNRSDSFNENALWIGAGYQSTGRTRFQTGLMYNVLHDDNSRIFGSAFRPYAGVSFGF